MDHSESLSCIYKLFETVTIAELEEKLASVNTREEKVFYRALINLKLQLAQEKIVGEILL